MNELAKGQKFMSVGTFSVSDDGNLLAYSTDNNGYRQYTLQVKDLRTGQMLAEKIERVTSVVWANDNKTFFYVTEDAVTKRSDKFYRHVVGTDKYDLVFDEKDELFDIGVGRSRDKAVIFLQAFSKTSTESRYLMASEPNSELTIVLPREPEHEYDVDYRNGLFYIRTNKGAKNFRIVTRTAKVRQKRTGKILSHIIRQSRSTTSVFSPITPCCPSGKMAYNNLKCSTSRLTNVIASSFPNRFTRLG